MISGTDVRFEKLNTKFRVIFGDIIPLMMIPDGETIEGLTEKVNKYFEAQKDLLPELYEWNDEDMY